MTTPKLAPQQCAILGELGELYYILQGPLRPDDHTDEYERISDRCDILWDEYLDTCREDNLVAGAYQGDEQDGNLVAATIAMCQYPRVVAETPRGEAHWRDLLSRPDLSPRSRLEALQQCWWEHDLTLYTAAEMAYHRATTWAEIGVDRVAAILLRYALSQDPTDQRFLDLAAKLETSCGQA